MKQTFTFLMLLSLAACATPTTQRPEITPDEIRAEEEFEQHAAIKNPFPPIVEPVHGTKAMKKRLAAVSARLTPEARRLCYEIQGTARDSHCSFALQIKGTTGINAYADGDGVTMSAPMMEFAQNDTHLAFVLAHELAHNIMKHPGARHRAKKAGIISGVIAGYQSTGFEAEADYVGLYILARAGYPIEQVPDFWRALSQYEPEGIYSRTSHPTNAERFVAMRKTIAEIRAKQTAHQPLIPNTRSKDA